MSPSKVAIVFDNTARPDTTGLYCRRALGELVTVEHFLPTELARIPREGFDLYLNIDDGLRYRLPKDLRPAAHEQARGWQVESVEDQNRGFDLISRKPHPEDPKTCIEVRFIEVKGRAGVGEVALTTNEYKTAERLKNDYWLYVVFNCSTKPGIHAVQDPARLGWEPIVRVEHYHTTAKRIIEAAQQT